MISQDIKTWLPQLKPYSHAKNSKAWIQILNTVVPFLGWVGLSFFLSAKSFWYSLVLAVPAAFFGMRLFIIQHDCGHGSFFNSAFLNRWTGRLLGVLTFTPYEFWKHQHAVHHATTGNLSRRGSGDVTTLTVKEYAALTPFQKLYYRVSRNPFFLFTLGGPILFFFIHRLPLYLPRTQTRSWVSVLLYDLIYVLLVAGLASEGLLLRALVVYVPILYFLSIAGAWAFYLQHQFKDAYWEWEENWDFYTAALYGSSFYQLPRLLNWFTGSIGYHHIHHLSSKIPNYELKCCAEALPELRPKTFLNLRTAFSCVWLALWDEDRRELISFSALRRRQSVDKLTT